MQIPRRLAERLPGRGGYDESGRFRNVSLTQMKPILSYSDQHQGRRVKAAGAVFFALDAARDSLP